MVDVPIFCEIEGRVFLDNPPWPKLIEVSDEFLWEIGTEQVEGYEWAKVSQGRLTFTVANTSAVYAFVRKNEMALTHFYRLVEGTFA